MKRVCVSVALASVACLALASSANADVDVTASIDIKPGSKPDPNCFAEGEQVEVNISFGGSITPVNTALVDLSYDPSCFSLVGECVANAAMDDCLVSGGVGSKCTSDDDCDVGDVCLPLIKPGSDCGKGDSPFDDLWKCPVVGGGQIVFGVEASPLTTDPATMACMSFHMAPKCVDLGCGIDWNGAEFFGAAELLPSTLNNSKRIRSAGEITTNIPDSVVATGKTVTWDPPTMSDNCDGPLGFECTCSSSDPSFDCFTVLINNGGAFPVSQTVFECHTVGSPPAVIENSCGNQRPGHWIVDVTCGDAVCDGGEDASSCPQDCGSPPPPPGGIPTVSQWGIAIMALLLLIGGKVYFTRRRATQA